MLRHLRIQSKLFLVLIVPVVVLGLVAALVFSSFNAIKVTGTSYKDIVQEKDLTADILPPPLFAVEAHGEALQTIAEISQGDNVADLNKSIAEVDRLRKDFETRHTYWTKSLTSSEMAATNTSMGSVYTTGKAFFDVYSNELVPIAKSGDKTNLDVIRDRLNTTYLAHKAAVQKLVTLSAARQTKLETNASDLVKNRTLFIVGAMAIAVLLILLLGLVVARLISAPLKAMTRKATEMAETGLPNDIATINSLGPDDEMPEFDTFPVESKDEVGQLAVAFNAMHASALGMASQQVQASRNYGENLITIGRRNQSLVFRTLGLISELESNERDPGTLENLFRLDALTTRMRRHAESLLVLAGDKPMSNSGAPVEISDVIRGALSEVDDYQRVDHSDMEDVLVRGRYVHSVVHLFAELIENGITYSPPTSRVTMLGRMTQYGYHIAIIDRGLGMSAEEISDVNYRLNNPLSFDLSPVRVLGHHVVSKLAERFNITVQLHDNLPNTGVTAGILLPHELLATDEADGRIDRVNIPVVVAEAPVVEQPVPVGRRAARRNQQAQEQAAAEQLAPALLAPAPVSFDEPFQITSPVFQHEDALAGFGQQTIAETTVNAESPWGSAQAYNSAPIDHAAAPSSIDYRFDSDPVGYQLEAQPQSYSFTIPDAPAYLPTPPTDYGFDAASAPYDQSSVDETPWRMPTFDDRVATLPAPSDEAVSDEAEPSSPITKTGFRKRVKGAQTPDTGPTDGPVAPERDAAALRSSLAGLQSGFDRAKRS